MRQQIICQWGMKALPCFNPATHSILGFERGSGKMRYLPFALVFLFAVPMFGQMKWRGEVTTPKTPFAVIAEQLQKARESRSHIVKRNFLLKAQKSVERLPQSPVTEQLRSKIESAFRAGILTDKADEAIEEAIETAKAADRVLRQPPPSVDPETAKATLLRVLSSPEFRDPWAPVLRLLGRISKWLERPLGWASKQLRWLLSQIGRILQPIFEWLSKLIEALRAWFMYWFQLLMSISPVLAWSILGVLGAIGLTSLAFAVLRWWRKKQEALKQIAVTEALVLPEQLLRESEIAARSGDYLTALRKAYRAVLLLLDRIGLIRFREQRTNWEYLAEVQKKTPSDFARRFQEVTKIFDVCFYARKLATSNEFAIVKQFAEETRQKALTLLDLTETEETSPR
ncbi:MAG: DUF4129 domain-containing protein [Armatimonadota bacterium]